MSIQDKFEYIMHGRLYNISNDGGSKSQLEVYVNVFHVKLRSVLLILIIIIILIILIKKILISVL